LSDGVDAAVEGVEPAALQSAPNRTAAQAKGNQLRPSHHAILALGEPGNGLVLTNLTFGTYLLLNVRFVAHAGQRASPGVTGG
jgi:hypothetical protein